MEEPKQSCVGIAESNARPQSRGAKETSLFIGIIAALAVVLTIFILSHFGVVRLPWAPRPAPNARVNGNIQRGSPTMTLAEKLAAMQEAADKNQITITINARPVFEDGSAVGSMYIVNPIHNAYHMEYIVLLKDTDQLVYQSPIMEPDTFIDSDKLSIVLPKGEYEAIAEVYSYDAEDLEKPLSKNIAHLVITIKN